MTDGAVRESFGSLQQGGIDWGKLPMRLFVRGNANFWNPADIDFSGDTEHWGQLDEVERDYTLYLFSAFLAGEEAVTHDIQPFMKAMADEGRLEDELYLTQFVFEEAKHVETFRRALDAIEVTEDLHHQVERNPGYRAIFYDKLPNALNRLEHDASPQAQIRASVAYNHIVEGTLALTGYHAFSLVTARLGLFHGVQEIVRLIGRDERRHMAWGTFTCRRHVAADESNWKVVEETFEELLPHALQVVSGIFDEYGTDVGPFGIRKDEMLQFATDRFTRRVNAIQGAVGKDVAEIEGGTTEIDLEEQFGEEEAAARDKAAEEGVVDPQG